MISDSWSGSLHPRAGQVLEQNEVRGWHGCAATSRGNADAAEIAIQSNWLQAAERYVSVIETVGERGTW